MSKKKPLDPAIYQVTAQEDPDTGDMLLPLPMPLLKQMGWKEGDKLDFGIDDKGKYIISLVGKVTPVQKPMIQPQKDVT